MNDFPIRPKRNHGLFLIDWEIQNDNWCGDAIWILQGITFKEHDRAALLTAPLLRPLKKMGGKKNGENYPLIHLIHLKIS
jgi:hypothetical protein